MAWFPRVSGNLAYSQRIWKGQRDEKGLPSGGYSARKAQRWERMWGEAGAHNVQNMGFMPGSSR